MSGTVTAVSRNGEYSRDEAGNIVRKTGIMSVVQEGGVVRPGDLTEAELPDEPHRPLDRV